MPPLDSITTLVMGAQGSVGRHVLDGLIAAGAPVRASARKPQPGAFPGGVDAVAADLTDPASLADAFAGIRQVFLYALRDGVEAVVRAAQDAGVERIVLLSSGSVIHPSSAGNAIAEEHREVESAFATATGIAVVPIRPLVLATNALRWAWPIRAGQGLALYRPDSVTAPIHERDIAAVAVAALLRGDSGADAVGGILTGPARLSQREQVAAIAAAIETDVAVTELTREEAGAQLGRHMPEWEAEAVLRFLDDADAGNSPATSTVEDVLGRPAIGFREWAREHADDFR